MQQKKQILRSPSSHNRSGDDCFVSVPNAGTVVIHHQLLLLLLLCFVISRGESYSDWKSDGRTARKAGVAAPTAHPLSSSIIAVGGDDDGRRVVDDTSSSLVFILVYSLSWVVRPILYFDERESRSSTPVGDGSMLVVVVCTTLSLQYSSYLQYIRHFELL